MLIAFDTNIFIYWLDVYNHFYEVSAVALGLLSDAEVTGLASVITITELRAGMKSMRDAAVLESFGSNLQIISVDKQIAEQAGDLRQAHKGLRTPDSIHLATAIVSGADKLITNDRNLLKLATKDIELVPLLSFKP